jgi:hypothetical protein
LGFVVAVAAGLGALRLWFNHPKSSTFPKNWLSEISRAVRQNYQTTYRYGSGFDSLLDREGTPYAGLLPACTNSAELVVATLTAADAAALIATGITNVYPLTLTTNATFGASANAPSLPIRAGSQLASAGPDLMRRLLGDHSKLFAEPVVYLFGLGERCDLIGPGRLLAQCPIHTDLTTGGDSKTRYHFFYLCFLVSGDTSDRNNRFLGSLCASVGSGFNDTEYSLNDYAAP